MAVVLVSHNMEDVAKMAKRLIVMNKGGILLDDCPRQIFQNCQSQLKESGLDVPPLTQLLQRLQENGIAADTAALTVEEGARSILDVCRRMKK